MLFNSLSFLIFYPLTTAIYFLAKNRQRLFILISASVIFYLFSRPIYIFLLLAVVLISFFAGLLMGKYQKRKKIFFLIGLLLILGVLGFFKYYNFIWANVSWLENAFKLPFSLPALKIVLPIGLSFYTFQAASYIIEVYLGRQKVEKRLPVLASFVMFYPTLLAGPIERPGQLIPQLTKEHYFDYSQTVEGLRWILWGLFKKIVVADRIAILVNRIYDHPTDFQGWPLIIATILYAFQIYYDFSAYAEIALGAAKVMGIDLIKNFNRPYISRSIPEFWRRWNISLSSWLKDYVYIPLGGNRVTFLRHKFNLMITFLVSGTWHGANWTFIFWGLLHGFYCVLDSLADGFRGKILNRFKKWSLVFIGFQIIFTFLLACFAWIFFRSKSFHDAFWVVGHLFSSLNLAAVAEVFSLKLLAGIFVLIILVEIGQYIINLGKPKFIFKPSFTWLRWAFYYLLVLAILFSFQLANQKFIYFQF